MVIFYFKKIVVGVFEVNCYIAGDKTAVYIIDPGSDAKTILQTIRNDNLTVKAILITHGHIDHISGVKDVANELNVPIFLHKDDKVLYNSPANTIPPFYFPLKNPPSTVEYIDTKDFEIIRTPGHTQGGVCFYFKENAILFTGDTIFKESIGRTDLPGGNHNQLIESIKNKIFTLPENIKIYPGHGDSSTIKFEKENNPFLI